MSKCPVCRFSKCRWIRLADNPQRLPSKRLRTVVDHNIGYIEMIFKDHQGSGDSEERMHASLGPYVEELDRRKKIEEGGQP